MTLDEALETLRSVDRILVEKRGRRREITYDTAARGLSKHEGWRGFPVEVREGENGETIAIIGPSFGPLVPNDD